MSKSWKESGGSDTRWRKLRAYLLASKPDCALCGEPGANSVDHIVPLSRGGAKYAYENCRPAHLACNERRGNTMDTQQTDFQSLTEW